MRCAVIGGVDSTRILLERLDFNGFREVMVFGFKPLQTHNVSGWCDLSICAKRFNYIYNSFSKVEECKKALNAFNPDVLFVVGLSQIIPVDMLKISSSLNVGFHPTALPKGRGRGAIPWSIIGAAPPAATLFELQDSVDAGDILSQELVELEPSDDAATLTEKILVAEQVAVDRLLKDILDKKVKRKIQDITDASWLGKRTEVDGGINWLASSADILTTVKANTKPYPGAYTFFEDQKIKIWKAEPYDREERGVPGRILEVFDNNSFVVQAGSGLILVTSWEAENGGIPKVGLKLGYYLEYENYNLRKKIKELECRLNQIESMFLSRS